MAVAVVQRIPKRSRASLVIQIDPPPEVPEGFLPDVARAKIKLPAFPKGLIDYAAVLTKAAEIKAKERNYSEALSEHHFVSLLRRSLSEARKTHPDLQLTNEVVGLCGLFSVAGGPCNNAFFTRMPFGLLDSEVPGSNERIRAIFRYFVTELKGLRTASDLEKFSDWQKNFRAPGVSALRTIPIVNLIQTAYPGWCEGVNPCFRPWKESLSAGWDIGLLNRVTRFLCEVETPRLHLEGQLPRSQRVPNDISVRYAVEAGRSIACCSLDSVEQAIFLCYPNWFGYQPDQILPFERIRVNKWAGDRGRELFRQAAAWTMANTMDLGTFDTSSAVPVYRLNKEQFVAWHKKNAQPNGGSNWNPLLTSQHTYYYLHKMHKQVSVPRALAILFDDDELLKITRPYAAAKIAPFIPEDGFVLHAVPLDPIATCKTIVEKHFGLFPTRAELESLLDKGNLKEDFLALSPHCFEGSEIAAPEQAIRALYWDALGGDRAAYQRACVTTKKLIDIVVCDAENLGKRFTKLSKEELRTEIGGFQERATRLLGGAKHDATLLKRLEHAAEEHHAESVVAPLLLKVVTAIDPQRQPLVEKLFLSHFINIPHNRFYMDWIKGFGGRVKFYYKLSPDQLSKLCAQTLSDLSTICGDPAGRSDRIRSAERQKNGVSQRLKMLKAVESLYPEIFARYTSEYGRILSILKGVTVENMRPLVLALEELSPAEFRKVPINSNKEPISHSTT